MLCPQIILFLIRLKLSHAGNYRRPSCFQISRVRDDSNVHLLNLIDSPQSCNVSPDLLVLLYHHYRLLTHRKTHDFPEEQ
jgi:hypothetical protein